MEEQKKTLAKRIIQYFFQGVIVIAPIAVTIYFVFWLFTAVDSILPNIFGSVVPGEEGVHHIPGVGILMMVIIMILIGWASSSFVISHFIDLLGAALEKTPGVKLIYSSVKDFLKAFSGSKKKFDKPVLVNVDSSDVWRMGFITQNDASQFDLVEHVVVYVPFSYAISGMTYFVPKVNIRMVNETISSAEAMKFVISGGVTEMDKAE
ncbi:DUF502 domain-containing protein [Arachidicoccus ginsenosidivorans]|jgi:uncharacterized membrane protein|uniref:DUF502 domain-containing protein n=1 Tax=Arachidicoccus ginsenosidivorans TaxID=496057 RepID=A0A5B8VIR4_9BACT|nr:DUF502 domain-containing protein [Arachidicoccus ginsenosidivorans]QEC71444.1 DUF502 domain-containing protein [Arachidicoccus ginsenosidivorans]